MKKGLELKKYTDLELLLIKFKLRGALKAMTDTERLQHYFMIENTARMIDQTLVSRAKQGIEDGLDRDAS